MLGISHWAASAFVLSIAMLIPRGAEAERSNGDVIVEWNQLLQTNITGLPIGQPRSYAMLHVAMADAVIAVRGRYQPFHADDHGHVVHGHRCGGVRAALHQSLGARR